MASTARLALALMAALGTVPAALAAGPAPVTEVVSFGDSLSDCGTYGFKPTTAPSPSWNQLVARHFGADLAPNQTGRIGADRAEETYPDGLCYAQGGARTMLGTPGRRETLPIAGAIQLDHFLAQHRRFTPNQLVTVYLGTNDLLIPFARLSGLGQSGRHRVSVRETRLGVIQAAKAAGTLVKRMIDHGALHIAVLNLYDLGISGFPGADARLSGLVNDFNRILQASLPRSRRVMPIDTHGLFDAIAADPGRYGISTALRDDACTTPTSLGPDCYADASRWTSPDADRTHLFIGMVHFTGAAETLLADYVVREIDRQMPSQPPLNLAGAPPSSARASDTRYARVESRTTSRRPVFAPD